MPERVLWSRLRAKQLAGLKFRRQHALGPYVADFYCAEGCLVVEVDGRGHEVRRDRDDARDAWMRVHGVRVLRVLRASASEVSRDLESVLRLILKEARKRE